QSLFVLYHIYIVPAFVLSRITQFAIPYMLIFGTLERLVWILEDKNAILKRMYSVRGHHITMCITLFCCITLRLPTAFATVVHEFPNCTDFFRSKSTGAAHWVFESDIYYFFDFHLLSIAQTFIPFFVLVAFNLIIVRKLTKKRKRTDNRTSNEEEHNGALNVPTHLSQTADSSGDVSPSFRLMTNPVRDAIYAMMIIVTTYLISNSLHLILTILERSKSSLLRDPMDANMASTFHTIFSDTVSFVYMFTSAIRVIIYCICDPTTRNDVKRMITRRQQENKKSLLVPAYV
uniref:G-protein coupled receptors family 1 profile domain-containing protein n=1 Tax=Parascaris univalens TaxID=6257 RepID=A0A915B4W5_PARUN